MYVLHFHFIPMHMCKLPVTISKKLPQICISHFNVLQSTTLRIHTYIKIVHSSFMPNFKMFRFGCKWDLLPLRVTYLYQKHCSIKLIMLLLLLTYSIFLITLHSFFTLISIYKYIEVYGILALFTQSWIIEKNIWNIKCNFIYI